MSNANLVVNELKSVGFSAAKLSNVTVKVWLNRPVTSFEVELTL